MKKLLSLVLICAMGFGMVSCVESEESPSVEAIRNAKAEQLKALAAYYNAEAQAKLIVAQAEAAYKAAQAAYEQALADQVNNDIEQAKAKFAYEIEMLKAKYEAQMLDWKKTALGYENEILAMADAKLDQLYANYSNYVRELNTANENLLNAKISLAQVEAEVIDVTEAANKEIEDNTAAIKEYEAQLAILTDNAYSQMDKDSLYTEYLKAVAAYNEADYNYQMTEVKAYTEAKEAAEEASKDYYNTYNSKVDEMNAMEWGIIGATSGDDKWTEEYQYSAVSSYRYYGYKWVDDDNDPATPAVKQICSYYDSDKEGDYTLDDGKKVIQYVSTAIYSSTINSFNHLNVFINEAPLLTLKKNSAATYKTALDNVEKYTDALENVKTAETTAKGFEKAFAAADAAREAIEAFKKAYEKYDDATETVKYKENALKAVKADTTGQTNAYNHYIWHPYETLNSLIAILDELTNEENEGYAENAFVKALAEAQKVLKDLKADEDATEDQIAQAEAAVAAAQKALNEAIYNAEVGVVNQKNVVATYESDVKNAEEDVEDAKENEKALLAANTAAITAVEIMNNTFGEDSDFYAFWTKEDENGNRVLNNGWEYRNSYNNGYWFNSNWITLLADNNEDGNPDLDLDTDNGLYKTANSVKYVDFTAAIGNSWPFDGYESPDFKEMIEGYVTEIAQATDKLTEANNTVATLKEWVNNWDAKEAELRAWVEAKNAEIEDVRAAYDAFAEAKEAKETVAVVVNELKAKYNALSDMLEMNANSDLTDLVEEIEEAIEDAEEAIANAEAVLASLKTAKASWGSSSQTIAYRETLIEKYKAMIAAFESDVEYYTIMVESAKAALDAALAAE